MGHMHRPFYYNIYNSGIIVEYLTQILTRVPRHLWLLNVRILPYTDQARNDSVQMVKHSDGNI